ncbi:hypothetical protein FIBSPDRAFT_847636 [Athelia psychrophila]|uniref:Uncharacterized protein n=1 Tax=Athelia psychrophila TaxID=1759441 RepID=A0A166WEY6_9AGAM|nr:hypothetical protein FIBSPDRAFT_847636 [Fibularhizoctonia sp. CBS 109695]
MSQYYTPRPRTSSFQPARQYTERPSSAADLDDSIYIFPSPSSAGSPSPLPSFGSEISAPTDLTLSESRISEQLGQAGADGGRRYSTGPDDIWDWNAHAFEDADSENGSVVMSDLELDVDRAQQWELLSYPGRRQPLAAGEPGSSAAAWLAKQRRLDSAMTRTMRSSLSSPASSFSEVHAIDLVKPTHHHTQSRCPSRMLAFLASCLFIDDSTLDLLTNPLPDESILFPGHAIPYSDSEKTALAEGRIMLTRGRSRLRSSPRESMRLACDPGTMPFSPFAMPSAHLNGLLELVNGMWTSGRRAWRGT